MKRSLTLIALIALACVIDPPGELAAQTSGTAAPVPGPYQAMAPAPTQLIANPGRAMPVPYWMRQQQPQNGMGSGPVGAKRQNFIPGWVWTNRAPSRPQMNSGPSGAASQQRPWQGHMQMQGQMQGQAHNFANRPPPAYYGNTPWGPSGRWPGPHFGAPQGFGAHTQPNQ